MLQPPFRHRLQGGRFVAEIREPLRTNGSELIEYPDIVPRGECSRGAEAIDPGGWCGVRYAQKYFHRLEMLRRARRLHQTLHFTVSGMHDPGQSVGVSTESARDQQIGEYYT